VVRPEVSTTLARDTDYDFMRAISRQSSSFAGVYRDRDTGRLVINLTDPSQRDAALQAVSDTLGADRSGEDGVEVRLVKYSMAQLQAWKDAVSQLILGEAGVVAVGVDVVGNRILVGVRDDQAKALVQARLTELNLSEDALVLALMQVNDAVGLRLL